MQLTPEMQEQFGRAWAAMARSEGHTRRFPGVDIPEELAPAERTTCAGCGVSILAKNKAQTCKDCRHRADVCQCERCRKNRAEAEVIRAVVFDALADGGEHRVSDLLGMVHAWGLRHVTKNRMTLLIADRVQRRRLGRHCSNRDVVWRLA